MTDDTDTDEEEYSHGADPLPPADPPASHEYRHR